MLSEPCNLRLKLIASLPNFVIGAQIIPKEWIRAKAVQILPLRICMKPFLKRRVPQGLLHSRSLMSESGLKN